MDASTQKSGFTLVETTIATLILILGLGTAAMTYQMAMRNAAATRNQMTALHAARQQLEQVRTLTFTQAGLSAGRHSFTLHGFTGDYVVSDVSPSVKDVTVNVNWDSLASGTSPVVSLSTSLSEALR